MWMHGGGGIMMGYAMGVGGRIAGGMSLYTVVNGRIAGGMSVYARVWGAIACPGPPKIGQIRGYSLPRTLQNRPKSGVSGGSRVLPPGPGGSPPAPGAENCQNRRGFNNSPIRDRNCTLSSAKVRRGVPGGPPGGPIFGPPRTPPGRPPGAPAKIRKIQGFGGSAKIRGFGGSPYMVDSYIGVCQGGWDHDGVCHGGWDHDGGCYGGYRSVDGCWIASGAPGYWGARPTGRYIDG